MGNLGHVALLVLVWSSIVVVGCWLLALARAELRWRRNRRRRNRLSW